MRSASARGTGCPRCVSRPKDWKGSDAVCAFPDGGAFNPDNWNCATMNGLRELAEEEGATRRWNSDHSVAVIPCTDYPDGRGGPLIVLGWYKQRGCTEWARQYPDGENLTLEVADMVLADFRIGPESGKR